MRKRQITSQTSSPVLRCQRTSAGAISASAALRFDSSGTNSIRGVAESGFALTVESFCFGKRTKPSALTSGPRFAAVPSLRCRGGATRRRAIPGPTALARHPCRAHPTTTPPLSLPTRVWRCLPDRGTAKRKSKARAIFQGDCKPVGDSMFVSNPQA